MAVDLAALSPATPWKLIKRLRESNARGHSGSQYSVRQALTRIATRRPSPLHEAHKYLQGNLPGRRPSLREGGNPERDALYQPPRAALARKIGQLSGSGDASFRREYLELVPGIAQL